MGKPNDESWVMVFISLGLSILVIIAVVQLAATKTPNPYAGCDLVATAKTGKSRPNVALKMVGRQYEWVETWRCSGGDKLRVVWR